MPALVPPLQDPSVSQSAATDPGSLQAGLGAVLQRIRTDPIAQRALLQWGAQMMQPTPWNQSAAGQLGSATLGAVGAYDQMAQGQRGINAATAQQSFKNSIARAAQAQEAQKVAETQRHNQATEATANTNADSTKKMREAQAAYWQWRKAYALANGQKNAPKPAAVVQQVEQWASALVSEGKFKDLNSAKDYVYRYMTTNGLVDPQVAKTKVLISGAGGMAGLAGTPQELLQTTDQIFPQTQNDANGIPFISTQEQYDALKPGSQFWWPGQSAPATKPK